MIEYLAVWMAIFLFFLPLMCRDHRLPAVVVLGINTPGRIVEVYDFVFFRIKRRQWVVNITYNRVEMSVIA